ncbi:MAG TPA: DUF4277 domain-containing protein, partial [Pirellulaceae bacterium]|nr:DUF4277 domain-containing protein [Pirellulaceae bacterium]
MTGSTEGRRGSNGRGEGTPLTIGTTARGGPWRLQTYQVGTLPVVNHYLERLRLRETLERHLPPDDPRQTIPTWRIVLLLVRNVLVSRAPLYAVPEWAARYGPELFDLYHHDLESLRDDRLGACLARLFQATTPALLLAVVRRALDEFQVSLAELHNDSTSVALHGDYAAASGPRQVGERRQPAITWGHSKDHRPDLKQLLFTLTVIDDGGVPVCFQVDDGNTFDDVTHRRTWDLLRQLTDNSSEAFCVTNL